MDSAPGTQCDTVPTDGVAAGPAPYRTRVMSRAQLPENCLRAALHRRWTPPIGQVGKPSRGRG